MAVMAMVVIVVAVGSGGGGDDEEEETEIGTIISYFRLILLWTPASLCDS